MVKRGKASVDAASASPSFYTLTQYKRKGSRVHTVVLGGGGAMGRITVRALAEDARVKRVTVADLSEAAAQRTIDWLARGREKATAVACDVSDGPGWQRCSPGPMLFSMPPTIHSISQVMRAALAAHVPYADLGGLFHMTRRQYELHDAFAEAGLTAVLGIGSTPGITNVLARLAADQLDTVERLDVRIGSADLRSGDVPFAPPYSIRTILDECTLEPMVFANGKTRAAAPLSGQEPIDFPAPIGQVTAMYTLHSEVALFPVSFGDRGLKHASFKIAFPPDFLDQLRLLVDLGLANTSAIACVARARARQRRWLRVRCWWRCCGSAQIRCPLASQMTAMCCVWWPLACATMYQWS